MFLDPELKSIQEHKNSLARGCDLRRRLFRIEVQGIGYGVRRTISNLTLGLVAARHIIGFCRRSR